MKIYDVENFPNPLRVRIALAEKNATANVEFVPVDLLNGEHRTEAFLAKNPLAGVPILELDDGTFISESTAITEYIDTAFEGPSLMGETAKERAVINMMQKRAESMVLDAVATYFHHATDGLGPELETYQNVAWGEKQGEKARQGFSYFNDVLAQSAFVAGEQFSIADITLYAGLVFAGFAQIAIPNELTHLVAWQEKVAKRPSVAA
ncbi:MULTISPECIES: glutathione S-transferase family protein [Pseudoalteromonas]|jgi:glutathione S-transferase|uniref:glutathione S-transferase family protein n=1 Tax=Pseudoalteromonas TaxID=53246 RepID=UPI0018CF69A5|nr:MULTISPECIES: glutathione S-transferase [Pseudoalteromonas]MBH0003370.1 glutathione S-transferase [Pseudoalteromonas sp. SWYJZ12]MBH0047585.1 glutathione S-transferase [Pseudoalteromonas sp. NZS11_1]MBH0079300.1 glutathione S-transferase [Pseudoalteromonas sp. NZS11]MDQ2044703.1 glutathione S-transferase [Pseudoalteromonas sp. 20-92]